MNALPVISHHLFVAAIEDPADSPSVKGEPIDAKAIQLEILDWTEPVPEQNGSATRRSSESRKS